MAVGIVANVVIVATVVTEEAAILAMGEFNFSIPPLKIFKLSSRYMKLYFLLKCAFPKNSWTVRGVKLLVPTDIFPSHKQLVTLNGAISCDIGKTLCANSFHNTFCHNLLTVFNRL